MKKILNLLLLMLLSSVCYSQAVLEIKFQNPTSGRARFYNTRTSKVDSVDFKNGLLVYKDKVDGPTPYWMIIDKYNDHRPVNFILSNEKTEVVFKDFKKSNVSQSINEIYPNTPYFLKDPNNNQAYYSFVDSWKVFYNTIQELSTDDSEGLLEKRKATYNAFLNTCDSVIQANSNELVSAVIIDYLLNNKLLRLEAIQSFYDYLAPAVKDSFFGLKIGEYAGRAGKVQPGYPAPDFELVDINNRKYTLSALKGKMVLLHFWSSSCAPCIKEAPELIELAESNADRMVTINISLDTAKDQWVRGIERAGIGRMNNVCDFTGMSGKVAQEYIVNVIPTSYLLDEKGMILLKGSLNQISEEVKKNKP